MQPRVESASVELEEHRRRMRERALLAACAALLCVPLALLSLRLALVVGIAAGCEALLAACSLGRGRSLLRRLALDPGAYVIPDVRRYGARMIEPKQRARLARSLLRLRADAAAPHSLLVRDRVADFWTELEALAHELASSEYDVEPTSAVACRELLTNGVESPLYNPLQPPDELAVRLHHIRAGIRRRAQPSPVPTGGPTRARAPTAARPRRRPSARRVHSARGGRAR